MTADLTSRLAADLHHRKLADGGFQEHPIGDFRPDATAWCVLALSAIDDCKAAIENGKRRLTIAQNEDGRISITPYCPDAYWPTALAILAWNGDLNFTVAQKKAIHFLLNMSGLHWSQKENSPFAHDTSIPGWPWVNATHSWVEPTALALLALTITGKGDHERARQATNLLLDRQLKGGGWNYGNTSVYGQDLHPMQDSTGVALQALAGEVESAKIKHSLDWLESTITHTRPPLSLSWGLLGLSAWGRRPRHARDLLAASLERQAVLGDYPTTHLSLLLLAAKAENGLLEVIPDRKGQHLG